MIQEIIRAFKQPFQAIWSIFDNDAHRIVSKRGQEILESKKTKIEIIHDVSKSFYCKDCSIWNFNKCKSVCNYCERFEN